MICNPHFIFRPPRLWKRIMVPIVLGMFGILSLAAAETVDGLLNQAQTAQRNGNLGEALILATKAASLDPANAQCHYVRGRLYAEDRQSAKAVADFDRALE